MRIFDSVKQTKATDMETMKLRNGLTAIAKTYANRTQAEKAQAKIAYEYGVQTSVYHRGTPFFLIVK